MAITYRIDAARRLAVVRVRGALAMEEMDAHAKNLLREPGFGPEMRQLAVLDITSTNVKFSDWMSYRGRRTPELHSRQIALVAPSDFGFGLARQYAQAYQQDGQEIRVFRDVEAACAWLKVTVDDVQAVEALP